MSGAGDVIRETENPQKTKRGSFDDVIRCVTCRHFGYKHVTDNDDPDGFVIDESPYCFRRGLHKPENEECVYKGMTRRQVYELEALAEHELKIFKKFKTIGELYAKFKEIHL